MGPGNDDGRFDDDLIGDALPAEILSAAVPVKLSALFPWHRPRKQMIRRDQWARMTMELIGKLKAQSFLASRLIELPDGQKFEVRPELKYLTLPGIDYLDVCAISETCDAENCDLTATGFLSEGLAAPLMARARVREEGLIQAKQITDTSLTFPREFESICSTGSGTLSELRKRAPFHVVNIDACGSIAPPSAKHSRRMIDAIHRLVEMQLGRASHRWLLFITVDVRLGEVDYEMLDKMCEIIRENAQSENQFAGKVIALLKSEAADLNEAMSHAKDADGRPFLNLFCLGFSKWLLHLAMEKGWSLKMKRSHCYSTRLFADNQPSMCSLAFEFLPPPTGLEDPFGVSRQSAAKDPTQDIPSLQVLTATSEINDLDVLLDRDADLTGRLNRGTHEMLKDAGYDPRSLAPLIAPIVAGQLSPPYRFPDLDPLR